MLARVRETALAGYLHQDLPFEKLVEKLRPERLMSQTPLFQVAFVLQNTPDEALVLPGLTICPLLTATRTAKFDLTLCLWDGATGLHGYFEYNTSVYDEPAIQRLAAQYETLLTAIVENPDAGISEFSLAGQTDTQDGSVFALPKWVTARRRQRNRD
jgi:non-ribosomal peptide synthetase component F